MAMAGYFPNWTLKTSGAVMPEAKTQAVRGCPGAAAEAQATALDWMTRRNWNSEGNGWYASMD